jgi:hypothetical protein
MVEAAGIGPPFATPPMAAGTNHHARRRSAHRALHSAYSRIDSGGSLKSILRPIMPLLPIRLAHQHTTSCG